MNLKLLFACAIASTPTLCLAGTPTQSATDAISLSQLGQGTELAAAESCGVTKIVAGDETFTLRASQRNHAVETEEYGVEGEEAEHWSELITCQRLFLGEARGAADYVDELKARLQTSNPTSRMRILQKATQTAVFAIEYQAKNPVDAQLAFVLVTAPRGRASHEIQIIQYSALPGRTPLLTLQAHSKYWQTRFQSQALLAQSHAFAGSEEARK